MHHYGVAFCIYSLQALLPHMKFAQQCATSFGPFWAIELCTVMNQFIGLHPLHTRVHKNNVHLGSLCSKQCNVPEVTGC